MADLISWITTFLTLELGTVGTTDVTLGLMVTFSLVAALALGVYKKIRGR